MGWCFGSTHWYVCKIKGLCEETAAPMAEKPKPGNLLFGKDSSEPEINAATTALIDSLKGISADTLVIVGKYFSDEPNGASLANQRAASVLAIFKSKGYDGPAKLVSSKVDRGIGDGKLMAVGFDSIINPEIEENDGGFAFTKTDEKITINFPVASADPHGDHLLINSLKEFAQKAEASNSKLMVSGHTDNTGTHESNIKYGQLRADVITDMLVEYGMKKENITAVSRGESQPIATNNTEEGKKQNRRVEIEISSN